MRNLKKFALETAGKVVAKMDELRVADAITEVFSLFKRCNKYIDETMPWALAKDESKKDRLSEVLYNLVEENLHGRNFAVSHSCRIPQREFWSSSMRLRAFHG